MGLWDKPFAGCAGQVMARQIQSPSPRTFSAALKYFKAGQFGAAEILVRQVLKRQPRSPDALHLSGMVAFYKSDFDRAEQLVREALKSGPSNPPALNDLGVILTANGKFDEADTVLTRAVGLAPHVAGFHLNLANLYKRREMWSWAETHYRIAIHLQSDYPEAFRGLSKVLVMTGLLQAAEITARQAVALDPKDAQSFAILGEVLERQNKFEAARDAFESAVAIAPDNFDFGLGLAEFLTRNGKLDAARTAYGQVIARDPDNGSAHAGRAGLEKIRPGDPAIANMQALLTAGRQGRQSLIDLHFGLSRAFEDVGDYADAFAHAVQGNALQRTGLDYSPAETEREFDCLIEAFSASRFSSLPTLGGDEVTPIFVVGMPRSGTSLVEQILSCHPQVFGAGELPYLKNLIIERREKLGGIGVGEMVGSMCPADFEQFGRDYLQRLRQHAPDARFIVDKMPANFERLGLIRMALPGAKVIYCQRQAEDNCLSIFTIQFGASGLGYACSLDQLGHYYRQHARLMAHWHALMPGFIFDNRYEDMVADQEAQTRKLLAFCGLDWNDACLEFFRHDRPVHTASSLQVRQPIYKSSVDRWKLYGDALLPLLTALRGETKL